MTTQVFTSQSSQETMLIAADFAQRLTALSIVWLEGPLAAGKTCFAAGVLAGLGGDPSQVASPTYALLHEYKVADGLLFHADLYRLKQADEVIDLGLSECYGRGPLLIEWPEMAGKYLGQPTYKIILRILTADNREITIYD